MSIATLARIIGQTLQILLHGFIKSVIQDVALLLLVGAVAQEWRQRFIEHPYHCLEYLRRQHGCGWRSIVGHSLILRAVLHGIMLFRSLGRGSRRCVGMPVQRHHRGVDTLQFLFVKLIASESERSL